MKKLFFIIGSQDLYGDETLKQAERNGREIAEFINESLKEKISVEAMPIVRNCIVPSIVRLPRLRMQ